MAENYLHEKGLKVPKLSFWLIQSFAHISNIGLAIFADAARKWKTSFSHLRKTRRWCKEEVGTTASVCVPLSSYVCFLAVAPPKLEKDLTKHKENSILDAFSFPI